MRCLYRVSTLLLIVAFTIPWPMAAMSIFDIIQLSENGYGDSQIIELIDGTGSVFELKAQDVPRLKKLGVSEAVIRTMLERVPEEPPDGTPRSDPASPSSEIRDPGGAASMGEHEHADESAGVDLAEHEADYEEGPGAEHRAVPDERAPSFPVDRAVSVRPGPGRTDNLPSSIRTTESLISFQSFDEERGGDHPHMVLTLSGLGVLVLRDEGAFPTMRARASEVAQRLEAVLALGDGSCYSVSTKSGPAVMFQSTTTDQRVTVIEITAADAYAYEIRSGRQVTPDLLAAYWADLLSDFIAIAKGGSPNRTLTLHYGDALGVLYQALKSSTGQRGGLRAAAELLPSSVRHHLERLAAGVPVDYVDYGRRAE